MSEDDDGPTMVKKLFGKSKSFFGGKAKPEKLPEVKEEIHPQMEKPVKEEKEVLFNLEQPYPTCLAIPKIMKERFPDD